MLIYHDKCVLFVIACSTISVITTIQSEHNNMHSKTQTHGINGWIKHLI